MIYPKVLDAVSAPNVLSYQINPYSKDYNDLVTRKRGGGRGWKGRGR